MATRLDPIGSPLIADARSDTTDRILAATFDRIATLGLARTTVEDVARAAGVSRQTVYRYFASKEALIGALVLREEDAFLQGARTAFAANDDLTDALEQGILFCLRFAREHPLLDRLLSTDSETLLPYLTTRGAPVIARAAEVLTHEIARKAWVNAGLLEETVDALTRVIISHTLAPAPRPADRVARDLARIATRALTVDEPARTTSSAKTSTKGPPR
jgi:AcrR family transcriptional regulator